MSDAKITLKINVTAFILPITQKYINIFLLPKVLFLFFSIFLLIFLLIFLFQKLLTISRSVSIIYYADSRDITTLLICGRGGTGRRVRLRGVWETVWVQVPPSAPRKPSDKGGFLFMFE